MFGIFGTDGDVEEGGKIGLIYLFFFSKEWNLEIRGLEEN